MTEPIKYNSSYIQTEHVQEYVDFQLENVESSCENETSQCTEQKESIMIELARLLIDIRRSILTLPQDTSISSHEYKNKLEESAEIVVSALDDLDYGDHIFSNGSEIYELSLWHYIQLSARFAEDGITKAEASHLFSSADKSNEVGIKHFFRQFVLDQGVALYRWGGGRKPSWPYIMPALFSYNRSYTDDRDVSKYSSNDAGGLAINFYTLAQDIHWNEESLLEAGGYDKSETRTIEGTPVKWDSNELKKYYQDMTSGWFKHETEFLNPQSTSNDPNNIYNRIISTDKSLFNQTAQEKSDYVISHIKDIQKNIDNVYFVLNEISHLFSRVFYPDTAQTLMQALIITVLSADTIDRATRALYIKAIENALVIHNYNSNSFVQNLIKIQIGKKTIDNNEIPNNLIKTITGLYRNDIILLKNLFEFSSKVTATNSCDKPYDKCFWFNNMQEIVNKRITKSVRKDILIGSKQMKNWPNERVNLRQQSQELSKEDKDIWEYIKNRLLDETILDFQSQLSNSIAINGKADASEVYATFFGHGWFNWAMLAGMFTDTLIRPNVQRGFFVEHGSFLLRWLGVSLVFFNAGESALMADDLYDHHLPKILMAPLAIDRKFIHENAEMMLEKNNPIVR